LATLALVLTTSVVFDLFDLILISLALWCNTYWIYYLDGDLVKGC